MTNGITEKPMIEVNGLHKEYHLGDETVIALNNVDLQIRRGEICVIFGTSGSGKSTLLNMLAGMEKPTRGNVRVGGVCISALDEEKLAEFRQKNLGFIFQAYNLLPYLTATENVAMPLMFSGMERSERERRARFILKKVGLGHRLDHYPSQMSGGQQQRTGIARALVSMPKVIYADEPTGNLDSTTTKEVMGMITGFALHNKQTIILVSHEPETAAYAHRIVTLIDGKITKDEKGGLFHENI